MVDDATGVAVSEGITEASQSLEGMYAAHDDQSRICKRSRGPFYGPLNINQTTALLHRIQSNSIGVKSANVGVLGVEATVAASSIDETNVKDDELPDKILEPESSPGHRSLAPLVKSHRSRQWTTVGSQTLLGAEVEKVEGQSLTYQWRQNGVDVPGAVSALYVISRVRLEDAGTYTCAVSNGAATAIWEEVMLHVSSPPEVTFEFRKISATTGARLALAVPFVIANPAPTFQWRLNGVDIPGAVSQQYDIEAASEADVGTYTCVLENLAGKTVWEETIVELRA